MTDKTGKPLTEGIEKNDVKPNPPTERKAPPPPPTTPQPQNPQPVQTPGN